ncbi:DUF6635 family protein [Oceanibaculum pacificum]|uniref:DUF6635 family protein n=1 Tax=Oceanibaculum pacificum TaxID=580166 RepID=UPI000A071435|nr:DUF6635 family protein [Oceanibaculum pacificum]
MSIHSDDSPAAEPIVSPNLPLAFDREGAHAIVDAAIARYCEQRRARVPAFVDRNFGLGGAWRLHRRAFGWDVLRAPANLAMGLPAAGVKLAATGARRFGRQRTADWLDKRRLFLETDVAREISWLLYTDLLELPYAQTGRLSEKDALAEAILSDPRVVSAFRDPLIALAGRSQDPAFRERLERAMATYTGSRAAAADITTAMIAAGVGAAGMQSFTPGVLSLGPALAGALAQKAAVAGFPMGAAMGGLWYGLFPAAASPLLLAGVTGGLIGIGAVIAAFAGLVMDPVQRRLGLHQRRLRRFIDHLEVTLRGDNDRAYEVRDLYVARLLDLVDLIRAAHRMTG